MRRGFLLGLMYGAALGVFSRTLLDWFEAEAHKVRRQHS